MNENIRRVFLITTLLVLLVGLGALSAADVSDNTTTTQSIVQDTPATNTQVASTVSDTTSNKVVDTQIATTSKTKSVDKDNTQTSTKTTKSIKSTPKSIDITSSNFDTYFTNSGLSGVNNGDTINFKSDVSRNDKSYIVDKAVNIKGNNHTINLNTVAGYSNSTKHYTSFNFVSGASNSNVSYIHFHNTQVYVNTTSNVTFDHINVTDTNNEVGTGVGVFSIRDGSINVTVNNSYFRTENNGGYSTLVLTYARDCTINNNTIIGVGRVGNLLYLNTYGARNNANNVTQNEFNVLSNNRITGPSTPIVICYALTISGPHNKIINNTVNYAGAGITTIWAGSYNDTEADDMHNLTYKGNEYINNTLLNGASFTAGYYSKVEGNTISGAVNIANDSDISNNIFKSTATIGEYSNVTNNNVTGAVNVSYNCNVLNNTFKSTFFANNFTDVENNNINGLVNITNYCVVKNNIFKSVFQSNYYNVIENNNISGLTTITYSSNVTSNVFSSDVTIVQGNRFDYNNLSKNLIVGQRLNIIRYNNMYNITFYAQPNFLVENNITCNTSNSNKGKSLKSAGERVVITNDNINNYFSSFTDTWMNKGLVYLSLGSDIKSNTVYYFDIDLNYVILQIQDYTSTLSNITIVGSPNRHYRDLAIWLMVPNSTLANFTIVETSRIQDQQMLYVSKGWGTNYSGMVADNITIETYQTRYDDVAEIEGNVTVKNSNFNLRLKESQTGIKITDGANFYNNMININTTSLTSNNTNLLDFTGITVSDGSHFYNNTVTNGTIEISGNSTVENSNFQMDLFATQVDWEGNQLPKYVGVKILSGSIFTNNTVKITEIGDDGSDNPTIFGIYLRSANNTFTNNNYLLNGTHWMYGVFTGVVNGLNVSDNNITVNSTHYTAGVYLDGANFRNNIVGNNNITLTAGNNQGTTTVPENVIYGVTVTNRAYMGNEYTPGIGNVNNNTIINNKITGNAYSVYGIEQFGGDNTTVVNNTILVNATTPIGIGMIGSYSNITGNNITVNGKDNTTDHQTADYIKGTTTGITLQRGLNNTVTNNLINCENSAGIYLYIDANDTITNNTINSLNNTYTVNINSASNNITVTNNTLKARELKGDNSVLNDGTDNTIKDNGPNTIATILTVEPITTVSSGSYITVTGKLVDEDGDALPSRQIHMVVENVTQMQITNNNGTFTKTIKVNNVGTYNITLTYEGNKEYEASNVTTTYTVTKANTTVTIDPIDGILGKEVSFTAHVTDENNQSVNGGYVIFKVNGVTLKDANNTPIQVNVTNGVAVLNTTATWSKAVNTTVAYSGNDNYNKARIDNGSITIVKQNATVSVTINENIKPGENLIAVVNVTDAEGNIVNAGTVIFKINGKTLKDENNQTIVYNVTNGQITLNYLIPENYSAKTYTLTAVYGGSIYNRAEVTQNFTITKLDSDVALNITTDNLKPGSQLIAVTTITDANGNPVTRGHVTFKLNDKTIADNNTRYVVDVTNGVATLNYTIPSNFSAKTYKLSAVFGGSNYNTNEVAQNITLSKIDTNIVTQNITITDNTLHVQATINNVETGNIANERTQKVSVKYDKHTVINSTVIENGVIDLNTTLTDVHAGEHIIEIVTSGNSIYNPNRVNATVTTQ